MNYVKSLLLGLVLIAACADIPEEGEELDSVEQASYCPGCVPAPQQIFFQATTTAPGGWGGGSASSATVVSSTNYYANQLITYTNNGTLGGANPAVPGIALRLLGKLFIPNGCYSVAGWTGAWCTEDGVTQQWYQCPATSDVAFKDAGSIYQFYYAPNTLAGYPNGLSQSWPANSPFPIQNYFMAYYQNPSAIRQPRTVPITSNGVPKSQLECLYDISSLYLLRKP